MEDEPSRSSAAKRTRILFSCAPCRSRKLKCDRQQPCEQCVRRGKAPEECQYAPRREHKKVKGSMSGRLQRLEMMVREMAEQQQAAQSGPSLGGSNQSAPNVVDSLRSLSGLEPLSSGSTARMAGVNIGPRDHIVQSEGLVPTYVGPTHFMAILDDIEDLKTYFDEEDEADERTRSASPEDTSPEWFMLSGGIPRTKEDFITHLPSKPVADRLISRYLTSDAVALQVIHRATFLREYNEFWRDPLGVTLPFLSLIFILLAQGVYLSIYSAPHELAADSDQPPLERSQQYRNVAGRALVASKYTTPTRQTMQAFVLYVESQLLWNQASQVGTYLLAGIAIRLMLKMGLHRDASKIGGISAFDGEMSRRLWNLAAQLDIHVSFYVGLPSSMEGIESDAGVPANLFDTDFDESDEVLPPGRPDSEWTPMSYTIWKRSLVQVFGRIARQAHALAPPTHVDVMSLNSILQERWEKIPTFMKLKAMDDSIGESLAIMTQRFGLAVLYQKSRCVLHRRYLVEPVFHQEHEESRQICLDASLALLDYQHTMHQACQPGGMLYQAKWFINSLAYTDFLMAAMCVYLVLKNDHHFRRLRHEGGHRDDPVPDRERMKFIIRRSHVIWRECGDLTSGSRKPAEVIELMLKRLDREDPFHASSGVYVSGPDSGVKEKPSASLDIPDRSLEFGMVDSDNTSLTGPDFLVPNTTLNMRAGVPSHPLTRAGLIPGQPSNQSSLWWQNEGATMDWTDFDSAMRTGSFFNLPAEEANTGHESILSELGFPESSTDWPRSETSPDQPG